MSTWLMEQTVITSFFALILLSCHTRFLKHLGAHYTYMLWAMIPMVLLGSTLQNYLPALWTTTSLASIQHYRIIASETVELSSGLLANLYLKYLYLLGIAYFAVQLIIQQIQVRTLSKQAHKLAIPLSPIGVAEVSGIHSPMLVGFIRPQILVPLDFKTLTSKQQHAILAHEIYHYRRGDHIANPIAFAITVLFWFNPLSWLAYQRFRHDQELACDAYITDAMDEPQKIAYSHALLAYSQHAPISMLHTHYGDKNILKERILQMKKVHGKNPLAILGLTLAMGLTSVAINQQAVAGNSGETAKTKQNVIYPVTRIEPHYPAKAVEQNLNGYVQLQFDISPKGKVENVSVINSSPRGVFDQSAIDALQQWVYQSSANGAQGSQVQLDFVMHEPEANVERIKVSNH
ncbi:TonB family protein [Shewanella waksmanii]|uniref:TonB family protein n=1 Tax=Shewanella waksmanii TaxID=213783 RepID=UPI0037363821